MTSEADRNWPKFIEYSGWIIAVISLILSVYLGFFNNPDPRISFDGTTRYAMQNNEWGLSAKVDGKDIDNNLFESILVITNTGGVILNSENMRGDYNISAMIGGNILKYKVESRSMGVVKLTSELRGSEIGIKFDKFDPRAKIYLKALTQFDGVVGDPVINAFGVYGNIVDFAMNPLNQNRQNARYYTILTFMITIGVITVTITSRLMQGTSMLSRVVIMIVGGLVGAVFAFAVAIVLSNYLNDRDSFAKTEVELFRENRIIHEF